MDLHTENKELAPVLHTRRLTLRPFVASDRSAVVTALNDWNVTRWLTQVPYPYGDADFDWFLNEHIPNDGPVWAIDAGAGLIGTVSVGGELGYWLAPDQHGQGIMTEAATAACDWHFENDDGDLASGYHLGNGPSCAVLTKLGFKNTHIDRKVKTARGEHIDTQRMVLTRADWMARHG